MTPTFPSLRDERGLLKDPVHVFKPTGGVDWRRMIPSEYLYVSPDHQQEVMVRQNVKTKWDVDVTKCEDKELLITLNGLKYLARLRGIRSAPIPTLHVSPTEIVCACSIEFEPNFENPNGLTTSGSATASVYNVSGKFQLYLASMAHNRALTRAIKDALGIEILGYDEVDFKASAAFEKALKEGDNPLLVVTKAAAPVQEPEAQAASYLPNPLGLLNKLCDERQITFDVLKARAVEYRTELAFAQAMVNSDKMADSFDPVNWTGFNSESICMGDALTLIEKIKAAKKAAKKGAK